MDALHQTSTTSFVYTSYDAETGEYGGLKEVQAGISNSESVEILSGLEEGETVWYVEKKDNPFKDTAQLKGKKIGVQGGTTSETFVTDELKQEPERTKSPAEAVAALKAGRVEFVIADIDPAKNCVKGEDTLAISDFITSEEYAIAIKKGQPELLKTINETIAEVKADGRLEKWVADFTAEADKLKDK